MSDTPKSPMTRSRFGDKKVLAGGGPMVSEGSQQTFRLELDDVLVRYRIVYSSRRRVPALEVTDDGQVVVRMPITGGDAWPLPEAIIREKASWVKQHVSRRSVWELSRPTFALGSTVPYLGEPLTLVRGPELRREGFLLEVPTQESSQIRDVVAGWMAGEASPQLRERLRLWGDRMAVSGPRTIRISNARTRWGYCTSRGVIGFSWRLLQAPMDMIDYVVVHELSHLRHPHHQAGFWAEVARVYPAYREAKAWFREHGGALIW